MVNNRGWIRIIEATIAILLIGAVVLIVVVSNHGRSERSLSSILSVALEEVAKDPDLRNQIITYKLGNPTLIERGMNTEILANVSKFLDPRISNVYNFTVRICALDEPCSLTEYPAPTEVSIYVEERIIATTLTDYAPRKVKLFLWISR